MQNIDITAKAEKFIRYGLICVLVPAMIIGYAEFKYWHRDETITLNDAKVVGTMVSVRILANGKVKELPFKDGDEVKAGDVIARLEVSITPEEIQQLENSVQLAKDNYESLQGGQWVRVPVQRERFIPAAPSSSGSSSGNVDKLKERADRMAELFEMGAVSAVQRDAARRAYESALANGSSGGGGGGGGHTEYYTEYVDEFRPTPAEVLAGAEQAIKQAELTLNVAKQEARETDVVAPVSGTIYYGTEVEKDLSAGESIARIGNNGELWIEAEVTEEIFDKIALGKLVRYVIDGKEIVGTVTEKIKPDPEPEPVELPDIPTSTNQPAALIGDAQTPAQPADGQTPTQPADGQAPAQPSDAQAPAQSPQGQPPKLPDGTEDQAKPNDKFIIKVSLPVERDFECRPNMTTSLKIFVNS